MSSPAQGINTGAAERRPGPAQAIILLVTSGLTVLVTAVLGPSMPAMQEHFKDIPNADYLVPLTMSLPMLAMAILSIVAGGLADKFGRKRLLVGATMLYALFGTAPLYLDSLSAIIASRVALGIIEAALMTISTTMIGDYYHGSRREKFMALQTTVASGSAFVLNNIGGLIAEHGWRAPYWVYSISLLLAPAMMIFLWEAKSHHDDAGATNAANRRTIAWRPGLLTLVCALGILLGIMFMTVPVHFGYLFSAIGVNSPSEVGAAYGLNSLGVISGTLIFAWVLAPRLKEAWQLTLGCLVCGTGFLLMSGASDFKTLALAGVINGLGAGMLLPTINTWCMRILPFARRGFGTGAYQSCLFLGMFLNPILVVWLEKQFHGSRATGIGLVGGTILGLAVLALVLALGKRHARVTA